MLMFILIGLSLVLIGIAGLQFSYLFYVDRLYRERQRYLQTLEQKFALLTERLTSAEKKIAEQKELIESEGFELRAEDETWADLIEDRYTSS